MGNETNDLETYGAYLRACRDASTDNSKFKIFKQNSDYTYVLEHTYEHIAHQYISLMLDQHKELASKLDWNKLKENDFLGNPVISEFQELGSNFGITSYQYSPSTIYYIYRGLDIIDTILKNKEKSFNILEIGGGYGGQCKILIDMCKMLDIEIENYGIVDLKEASNLQKKYLSYFNYPNVEYLPYEDINSIDVFKKYNTVISMYALTEFDRSVQDYYIDGIIKHVDNFYILCNNPLDHQFFRRDNSEIHFIDPPNNHWPTTGFYHGIVYK